MKNLQGVLSFVESAACGSFTAAAERLEVTPAAVSKNVLALERQLNVRLFNRSTRRLTLTDEGRVFLHKARSALRMLDEGVNEVSQASEQVIGRVRVTTAVAFGRRYVLNAIPKIVEKHPRLEFELNLENRPVDIFAERFDIGIRGGVVRDSNLVVRRIARLDTVLVASPNYLRNQGIPASQDALAQHVTLGVCNHLGQPVPWKFRPTLNRADTDWLPSSSVRVSDPAAALDLALDGYGIAQVGLHLASPFLRSGQLKMLLVEEHDPGDREFVIYYPHRQLVSSRVRVVVDALLAHLHAQEDLLLEASKTPEKWRASTESST